MTRTRLAATAALSALSLITSQVLAGTAPPAPPSEVVEPTDLTDAPVVVTTPHFDGRLVNQSLATSLLQGSDQLVGFSRCKVDGRALIDHCLSLSVGDAHTRTQYTLIDTPCPTDTPASACYAGYVIAGRATSTTTYASLQGQLSAATHTDVQIGLRYERTIGKATKVISYRLGDVVAMTMDRETIVDSGSSTFHQTIVLGDEVLVDDGWESYASGGLSCADLAGMLATFDEFGISAGSAMIGLSVATVGVVAGLAIGIVGSGGTLGTGAGPAIAAGAAVAASGIALGTLIALTGREVGRDFAKMEEPMMRELCEYLARAYNFNPEDLDLDDILDTATSGDGGGCPSGTMAAVKSWSVTEDGADYTCSQDVTISCTGGTTADGDCDCDMQDSGTAVCLPD